MQCLEVKARRDAIGALQPQVRAALLGFMAQEPSGGLGVKRRVTGTREAAARNKGSLWSAQRGDVRKFKGRICFGFLCLTTREQDDRESALASQAILEQLRDAVALASAAKPGVREDEEALLHIYSCVLRENGISEAALGLRACVTLRATRWLGETRIVTPASNLTAALMTRKRLLRARAISWQALRAEWIALLQGLANRSPCSLDRAEAIVDSARSKALKRQLSHAIRAVERTLWPGRMRTEKRGIAAWSQTEPGFVAASEGVPAAKRCRPALDSGLEYG